MSPVGDAVSRTGLSRIVRDEHRTGRAPPGVPGPAEVAHGVPVGPTHVGGDERAGAVGLTDLARDQRNVGGDGRVLALPARGRSARVEVVVVDTGRQLV